MQLPVRQEDLFPPHRSRKDIQDAHIHVHIMPLYVHVSSSRAQFLGDTCWISFVHRLSSFSRRKGRYICLLRRRKTRLDIFIVSLRLSYLGNSRATFPNFSGTKFFQQKDGCFLNRFALFQTSFCFRNCSKDIQRFQLFFYIVSLFDRCRIKLLQISDCDSRASSSMFRISSLIELT